MSWPPFVQAVLVLFELHLPGTAHARAQVCRSASARSSCRGGGGSSEGGGGWHNVRVHVLATTIGKANRARNNAGLPPIQEGVTNHTLRRTFASLLYEAGASPAYVMAQMRHTSSALALEVYARKMDRQPDTGERMDALLRGADWAQTGTNGTNGNGAVPSGNRRTALAGFSSGRCRGRTCDLLRVRWAEPCAASRRPC